MPACSTLCSPRRWPTCSGPRRSRRRTLELGHVPARPRQEPTRETRRRTRLIAWLAQFVVLYPAVNVLATYPLNVITFDDALLAAHRRFQANGEVSATPPSRTSVRIARLVAAVPPLVGACIQPDISSVTNVTGCFGLFLCAVVPGVLGLAARRLAPGPTGTSPLNGKAAAVALVLVGLVLTAGSLAAALLSAPEIERANARGT